MHKVMLFCTSVLVFLAAVGFASNADAMVALCVGCTTNAQFEGAAWQVFGGAYTQGTEILVVNPESGLSKWVYIEHLPPGVSRNTVPVVGGAKSQHMVLPGVATTLDSNPFAAIYIAKDHVLQTQATGTGIRDAMATGVAGSQQIAINTAIALTKKTYFVQLNPSSFPSYEGSIDIQIANQNYASLSAVPGLNWPPSALAKGDLDALLKVLGLYTGHSFTVCDVFGNGDSACFVPDPANNDILTQTGSAKNAAGQQLTDIANRVAGGGGGGLDVTRNPPNIEYFLPPGGGGHVVCGFVDGTLSVCVEQE